MSLSSNITSMSSPLFRSPFMAEQSPFVAAAMNVVMRAAALASTLTTKLTDFGLGRAKFERTLLVGH